jgi:hypothetical protein
MLGALQSISDQDARSISSTKPSGTYIGQLAPSADGQRWYRLTLAGGTTLAPGKLTVNADVDSNVVNKTIAATAAIGTTQLTVDVSGTVVADAYAGGFLTINDATGEGNSYLVRGNTGRTGAGEITVVLAEPLTVAVTVDVSEYTLKANDYSGAVISATDQADLPLGVPNVSITNAYYGWTQTGGPCSVLWDEAVAKGLALTIGTGVAGAVEALDAAGEPQIGIASMAGVDTEYQEARLSLF